MWRSVSESLTLDWLKDIQALWARYSLTAPRVLRSSRFAIAQQCLHRWILLVRHFGWGACFFDIQNPQGGTLRQRLSQIKAKCYESSYQTDTQWLKLFICKELSLFLPVTWSAWWQWSLPIFSTLLLQIWGLVVAIRCNVEQGKVCKISWS